MSASLSIPSKALSLWRRHVRSLIGSEAAPLRGNLNSDVLLVGPPYASQDVAYKSTCVSPPVLAWCNLVKELGGPDSATLLCVACTAFGHKATSQNTAPVRQFVQALDQIGQLRLIVILGKDAFKTVLNSGKNPPASSLQGRTLSVPPYQAKLLTLPDVAPLALPFVEDEYAQRRAVKQVASATRIYAGVLKPVIPLLLN